MDISITEILTTLATILSGIGIGWLSKSGRVKEKADAYKKMGEAYQYRIDSLHDDIDTCNKTIKENQSRIAELNHSLNAKEDEIQDKKKQIRNLTDKMWQAEQEVNRVQNLLNDSKDEIIRLTQKNEQLERVKCVRPDCRDPRGPKPPRKKETLKQEEPR